MRVKLNPFIEFAYGDKRKDKSRVSEIIEQSKLDYDPAKDRYKQFREALTTYEEGGSSEDDFLSLYKVVARNKSAAFKKMSRNYIDLKEDHGLVWDGVQRVSANLSGLEIQAPWYLHTSSANLRRIINLNFRKEAHPKDKEKGILTLLQVAEPSSAGVGILNIQASTLIIRTRIDYSEQKFLEQRAGRFFELAQSLS